MSQVCRCFEEAHSLLLHPPPLPPYLGGPPADAVAPPPGTPPASLLGALLSVDPSFGQWRQFVNALPMAQAPPDADDAVVAEWLLGGDAGGDDDEAGDEEDWDAAGDEEAEEDGYGNGDEDDNEGRFGSCVGSDAEDGGGGSADVDGEDTGLGSHAEVSPTAADEENGEEGVWRIGMQPAGAAPFGRPQGTPPNSAMSLSSDAPLAVPATTPPAAEPALVPIVAATADALPTNPGETSGAVIERAASTLAAGSVELHLADWGPLDAIWAHAFKWRSPMCIIMMGEGRWLPLQSHVHALFGGCFPCVNNVVIGGLTCAALCRHLQGAATLWSPPMRQTAQASSAHPPANPPPLVAPPLPHAARPPSTSRAWPAV